MVKCPECGESSYVYLLGVEEKENGEEYLYRCEQCSLIFTSSEFNDSFFEDLEEIFDELRIEF